MKRASKSGPYTCRLTIGRDGFESFQILIDKNLNQTLYPDAANAHFSESNILGPDVESDGLSWMIMGSVGDEYDVSLDWVDSQGWALFWECASAREGMQASEKS